jgi:hypothetical protein
MKHLHSRILAKLQLLAALLALAGAGSGCILVAGNSEGKGQARPQPTLGQQLLDLKKARESGALNEADYQAQKQKLLTNAAPAK